MLSLKRLKHCTRVCELWQQIKKKHIFFHCKEEKRMVILRVKIKLISTCLRFFLAKLYICELKQYERVITVGIIKT